MEFPDDLKYSKEHEWVLVEGSVATVGITDYAQDQLGDIVFVELPAVGDKVSKEDAFGVVESVKAVSDVYAPVSGKVLEVNDDLPENPEMLNEDSVRRRLDDQDRDERSRRAARSDDRGRVRGVRRGGKGIARCQPSAVSDQHESILPRAVRAALHR